MFLTDIAADALANSLRLEFTRLQLTLSSGNLLCTENGRGTVKPTANGFLVYFVLRRDFPLSSDFRRHLGTDDDSRKLLLCGTEANGNTWHAVANSIEDLRDGSRSGFALVTSELRKVRARSSNAVHSRMLFPLRPAGDMNPLSTIDEKRRFPTVELAGLRIEMVIWQGRVELLVAGTCSSEVTGRVLAALAATVESDISCVYMEEQSAREQVVTIRSGNEIAWLDIDGFSPHKFVANLKEHFPTSRYTVDGSAW
ncbi:MAG: hypothetical protein KY410_08345 [Proteobacteria bacterium]|nr:hypothetical protein [Pseudomonadota bacterium]